MKLIKQQIWRENPETMLSDFLENQTSVSVIDVLGRIIYANNKFCELIEIPEHKIKGELNIILKSERHANPLYKDLWAVIKSGQIWKGILSGVTNSGNFYKLETTIIPGKNKDGDIDRFVAFYINVDANDEVKVDSKISLDPNNKTFQDTISQSVFTINVFGEIIYANQGFRNLSETQIIGRSFYSFINPIFHDMIKNIVKDVFNHKKPDQFETIGINSDGVNTIFVSQIGPVVNNRGVVVSATISTQEFKDFNTISHDLMEREAKYHAIFQSMKVGIIVVVNNEGQIIEWNKGAELAFGYTENEIKGKDLTRLIATKNRKTGLVELISAVNNLEDFSTSDTIEMKGVKKNGTEFILELALSKWINHGETFYCAMMLDVSKRKKAERKLKQKKKELELFVYQSAHDLKGPLSSAEGLLHLIKQEELNESVHQLAAMLNETLDNGKSLVDRLMYASLVREKNKVIELVNFKYIIANVLKSFKEINHYNKIRINVEVDEAIEYHSSNELMTSLFQNLIQNAIKYSLANNTLKKPEITIKVFETQKNIQIKVIDTGVGILKKNLTKIFNLYFRENLENTPGFGLGLYIVKNIVDDLKGEIKVHSKVNEGTCFSIKLKKFKHLKIA